jgi:hypothetical protein
MYLSIEKFPNCCNAYIIGNFGGTHTAVVKRKLTQKQIESDLNSYIHTYGGKLLVATTNNKQITANRALRACGFKRTKYMEKRQHPETKLAMWWKPIDTSKGTRIIW